MTATLDEPATGRTLPDDGNFGLALLLAALAGWVDAAGLATSGGIFLSFMSGNTTDLGAAITHQHWHHAALIAAVIALFVLGVAAGEIIEPWGRRFGQSLVLAVECLVLATAAALHWPRLPPLLPADFSMYPMVFAMGLQNATMHRAGGIGIGLTYITGTLVQIGRAIAGRHSRRTLGRYLALWLSLAAGAALGALASSMSVLAALSAAAGAAGLLAVVTALLR